MPSFVGAKGVRGCKRVDLSGIKRTSIGHAWCLLASLTDGGVGAGEGGAAVKSQ